MGRATFAAIAWLGLSAAGITAQEPEHGEQAEKLGTVHFATSCNPAVAPKFDRAVALLHSFEFGASIRGFNDALAADSTCAMAYWGLALSRWGNPMGGAAGNRAAPLLQEGANLVAKGAHLAAAATERERGYLAAVDQLYDNYQQRDQRSRVTAYSQAMEDLALKQPADTEGKIFYALSLVAAAPPTDKTYANQLKAGAILESLWAKAPNHPGLAHYIIHAYDYPALADKARAAAARYATIAPSAAHALHMPSHTFTRVGMWKESAEANERSSAAALATGSFSEALHAWDYEMYAYLQMGDTVRAKAVLDRLPSIAAQFNPNAITGAAPPSAAVFALTAIPARWVLEREAWSEAAQLQPRTTSYPYADAMTHFARAIGAAHTGALDTAKASVAALADIQQSLVAKNEPYWAEQVAIQHLAAHAWLELAQHRNDDALRDMREAATREDATDKSAVTPGPLAPARELLGDMLVTLGRSSEAIVEYQSALKREPNRRRLVLRLASTR
jgi:hypothetical protein